MRLIDADKVKHYVLTKGFYCDTKADRKYTAELIDQLFPTVEAEPVKHGHWGNYLKEGLRWKCSECGSRYSAPYHYCPNCGAKMDEVEENETR